MGATTVGELMEELEEYDENTEIRLAIQPSWPFEHTIGSIIEVDLQERREEFVPVSAIMEPEHLVVYLGQGGQIGYLPQPASEELGWK